MNNTSTTSENGARTRYVNAAFEAAGAHNVLSTEEREMFASLWPFENELDLSQGEDWAQLVVFELSNRCRSFTPPVLSNLVAMGRACGSLIDPDDEE